MRRVSLPVVFLSFLSVPVLAGGELSSAGPAAPREGAFPDWISPHFHAFGVAGNSTADPAALASGHHDPQRDGFNFNQGLEGGFSLRAGEWLEAFTTGILAYDSAESEWNPEMEEAFGKIKNISGGFELRGGRYLNRFGRQNALHPHGYDFVDQNLVNGLFLGDDGLATDGGEISWLPPTPFTSVLSVSYGKLRPGDDHGHEHGGDDGEEEYEFEAEGANFAGNPLTARYLARGNRNDFHQFAGGVSWARGKNGFARDTQVFGVDFEYQWRENGLEAGGRAFRWNNEVFVRQVEARSGHLPGEESAEEEEHDEHGHDEHEEHGETARDADLHQTGFASSVVYTAHPRVDLGLRAEWAQGLDGSDQGERWRLSPAVTFRPDRGRHTQLRLQYNFDHRETEGADHSVWLQFGFNFGGSEVR